MKLTKSKNHNENYLAKIVKIDTFTKHPNPKCERMKCCSIDGFNISVGIDTEPGIFVYFPVECQINSTFLSKHNLFRNVESNDNTTIKGGFFESNRRVRMVKLQGEYSEGFVMPISSLFDWVGESIDFLIGDEFDKVGDRLLLNKYQVQVALEDRGSLRTKRSRRAVQTFDQLVENQFNFHYDTNQIKKSPHIINKHSLIQISEKVHGTSGISAYVLCNRDMNKKQKVGYAIARFFTNLPKIPTVWNYIWSSRKVIKNRFINKSVTSGYYNEDIWSLAHKIIEPFLYKGITLYYEIVGYCPSGKIIQKDFDYGCECPNGTEEFTYGKHYKIKVYRITYTNVDGKVLEFSTSQVQQWCSHTSLEVVNEYYYGYARDLYTELKDSDDEEFGEKLVAKLSEEKEFFMELNSPTCKNKVPHEGIVIKIEDGKSRAFKLKCKKFLDKESKDLDLGEVNIEE